MDPIPRLNAALEGRYRIERELGEGGMATVYLADDLKHERKVALKVLKPELAAVVGAERFLAEIKTTAKLQHPNILPLFDSGEADGFLFYVMPDGAGEALRPRSRRVMVTALCGFANLGSMGILVGGLGSVLPDRRGELAGLTGRAVMAGTLATLLTAAVVALVAPA